MSLTSHQKAQFERDGFLIYGPILAPDELGALSERIDAIASGQRQGIPESAVRLEAAASRGQLNDVATRDRVWQIWDGFRFDDIVMAHCARPRILGVIAALLGTDLKLYSDQTLMKPAFHGSEIPWHQDSIYWPIEPYDLVSCWVAIDEATKENGTMELIPGSHCRGIIPHRGDLRINLARGLEARAIPAELPAGGCVFHHSLTLHRSPPNLSPKRRRAISSSYMRAESRYTGDPAKNRSYPLLLGRAFEGCV